MQAKAGHRPLRAIAEVVAVAVAYIAISTSAVGALDVSLLFPASWPLDARATGSGFLIGAVIQVVLVLVGAYLISLTDLQDHRRSAALASARPLAARVAGSSRTRHQQSSTQGG